MNIEDVEKLEEEVKDLIHEAHSQGITDGHSMARVRKPNEIRDYVGFDGFIERWIKALRAEAWHPIERAEELGAKDGRYVLLWCPKEETWQAGCWEKGRWECKITWDSLYSDPTHFRFINPPEGA